MRVLGTPKNRPELRDSKPEPVNVLERIVYQVGIYRIEKQPQNDNRGKPNFEGEIPGTKDSPSRQGVPVWRLWASEPVGGYGRPIIPDQSASYFSSGFPSSFPRSQARRSAFTNRQDFPTFRAGKGAVFSVAAGNTAGN